METLGAQPSAPPSSPGINDGFPSTNHRVSGNGAVAPINGGIPPQQSPAGLSHPLDVWFQTTGMPGFRSSPTPVVSAGFGSSAPTTDQTLIEYRAASAHFIDCITLEPITDSDTTGRGTGRDQSTRRGPAARRPTPDAARHGTVGTRAARHAMRARLRPRRRLDLERI